MITITLYKSLPDVPVNTYTDYQVRPVRLEDNNWEACELKQADVVGLYGIQENGLAVWITDLPIKK